MARRRSFSKIRITALLALVLLSVAVGVASAADTTETVNPADFSTTLGATDWHIAFTAGTPTSGIVSGPATPPLGTGSLQMTTGAGVDKRYIMNYDHASVKLADITHLSYSTYGNSTTLAVVLQLRIDPDGAGAGVPRAGGGSPVNFSTVSFEPYLVSGSIPANTWQAWDVLTAGAAVWGTGIAGDAGNGTMSNPATWAEFVAFYPDATIVDGLVVNVGSGWATPFTGNVDALKIGYGGNTVTYDFEPAVACTTDCYADAVNGNDLNGGASPADAKKTIQAAVNAVNANGTVHVAAGTYAENVTVPKSLTLTGAGQTNDAAGTILEGTGRTGSGIFINNNITDVTIEHLRVQNYNLSAAAGVYGNLSNNGLTVQHVTTVNNGLAGNNGGGIYMNGPVDDVLIDNVTATNNRNRGIVIWNGFKTNITLTNNTVSGNNCCGIELQDGTASGVTATGNTVTGNVDSGMAFIGLMAGAGPNVIANNTVTNNGRFGIEIKLPNGTGLDTGDGSIVVEDNNVSLSPAGTLPLTEERDIAGISVYRRGFVVSENNVDIPTGVIVRNNTISGYQQNNASSDSTGFGIVVEGTNMHVTGNTLTNNDVGVQVQAGHTPYVANTNTDGNQTDLADTYFGRGNSPVGCAAIGVNTFSGNTVDTRNVNAGGGVVTNADTGETFCSIQAAINDTDTVNGHTLQVSPGTYAETVAVNKSLTIVGAAAATTIVDPAAGNAFNISVDNVTLKSMTAQGGTSGASVSGPRANITFDSMRVVNNSSYAIAISNSLSAATNIKVIYSFFSGNAIGVRMSSTTIVDGLLIDGSTFQNQSFGFYQATDSNDGHVKNLRVTDSTFTNLTQHGVYFEEGMNVEVDNSTFTGNFTGVYLFDAYDSSANGGVSGNVNIHDNTFTDHKYGSVRVRGVGENGLGGTFTVNNNTFNQAVGAFNTGSPTVTVSPVIEITLASAHSHGTVNVTDNSITLSGTYNTATAAYGMMVRGGVDTVNITGNTIDGGGVGTNGGTPPTAGIYVISNHASYGALKATSVVNATKNLINAWPIGVVIYDEVAAAYGGVPTGASLKFNRNDITGNATYGMQSGAATESDATCNWWGNANGPSGEGPGSGDAVSTFVDFTPWLFSNDLDGDCYVPGTITVVKETTPDGDTTEFEFDPSWSATNFTLADGQNEVSPALNPDDGPFSVAEVNLPMFWTLDNAECTNGVTTADPSSIPLAEGESWTCTFENIYTPPPPALIYISPNVKNGVVDGVVYNDQDILVNTMGTSDWEMFFDGSTFGIIKNLTDFTFDPAGCLLMTFNGNQKLGGVTYTPRDVAKFCPTVPGNYTAGTFSMVLDGSDVGLTTVGEIIDALELLPDGRLVISTKGNAKVPGTNVINLKAQKNDMLVFDYISYGPSTTGTWDLYFNNTDVVGLNVENIISSYIDGSDKYMTFWADFTVGDETGDFNDIVVIHGDNTVDVFWDANDWGYTGRIHGLHMVLNP